MSRNSLIFFANSQRYSCTKLDFPRIIHGKSELSRIIPWKGMPFWSTICCKVKLSTDYTAERHELFCIKAGFSAVKSVGSSADYPAERHAY
jgi:hypothetical protein